LNFRGFYTVLLERNDELIAVANVRVFGDKVAEIPLVGTRFLFRRLGMCKILMDELEKQLMNLGVERLMLPAVPSVLDTWINGFGFSKLTDAEKMQYLDHTFLDFPGTIKCQKVLL
jgi:N-acetylglutamate synthase-like GNAT family acetyltransferase